MKILAIDTSCDETAVAVTENCEIISNIVWSQASAHAKFGGVFPSLAQRMHEERIDFVTKRALGKKYRGLKNIDAIAVTVGNGLAVALGIGIEHAKKMAHIYDKPLIPVNHKEGHLLSSFALPSTKKLPCSLNYPALGLVLSGKSTDLVLIKGIGKYEILAQTSDDALGEALDKGARLLGLGYPGGAILEKMAKLGNPDKYVLPLPLQNDVIKNRFSYSGIKTAFVRLFESLKDTKGQLSLTKQDIYDLAAVFQKTAFTHIIKVLEYQIKNSNEKYSDLLFGGGVANNTEIKKMLRKTLKKYNIKLHTPYNKKLNGDNAGMIGVCAYFKNKDLSKAEIINKYSNFEQVDRNPRLSI